MNGVRLTALSVLVAAAAGCGGSGSGTTTLSAPTSPTAGFVLSQRTPAPSFLLRDETGTLVGPQAYRGRWLVVTFLYTHCPDVCPLIANQLAAAQRANKDLRVLAVSVDPKRDTRTAVRSFLRTHHAGPNFHYVTGPRTALAQVWRKYHIAALPGPSGTVSHSAFSLLVDPQGRERVLFDSQVTARQVLTAVAR